MTTRVALLGVLVTLYGCGQPAGPVTPTAAVPGETGQIGETNAVSLIGLVRGPDVAGGSFTLYMRTGSRLVRLDERTQVWDGGSRVRIGALRDGLSVGVRGTDHGRFIAAQMIGIIR